MQARLWSLYEYNTHIQSVPRGVYMKQALIGRIEGHSQAPLEGDIKALTGLSHQAEGDKQANNPALSRERAA